MFLLFRGKVFNVDAHLVLKGDMGADVTLELLDLFLILQGHILKRGSGLSHCDLCALGR